MVSPTVCLQQRVVIHRRLGPSRIAAHHRRDYGPFGARPGSTAYPYAPKSIPPTPTPLDLLIPFALTGVCCMYPVRLCCMYPVRWAQICIHDFLHISTPCMAIPSLMLMCETRY
jgi:hypothetical protein